MRQFHAANVERSSGDSVADYVAVEEPLEIRIGGEPVTVTMRTPGNDAEFVAGMLLTEGLIAPGRRPLLRQEHPNVVNVAAFGLTNPDRLRRAGAVATSCGLCGKASAEAIHQRFPPVPDGPVLHASALYAMLRSFEAQQPIFNRTGGVHAAGVFATDATAVAVREDIGRHNAVDKVIGHAVLRDLVPLNAHVLLVSGRASFEIVQKALGAGIPIIAAVSAPSSLAVELGAAGGQTLIGFFRGDRFNIYSHPERVALQPASIHR